MYYMCVFFRIQITFCFPSFPPALPPPPLLGGLAFPLPPPSFPFPSFEINICRVKIYQCFVGESRCSSTFVCFPFALASLAFPLPPPSFPFPPSFPCQYFDGF